MSPEEEKVLEAVHRWYRCMLRKETLEAHEGELFHAVLKLRMSDPSVHPLPGPPKVPVLPEDFLSSSQTHKDFPAAPEVPLTRAERDSVWDHDEIEFLTTRPIPSDEQDRLLAEAIAEDKQDREKE